jgi:hypothetical protein
LRILGAAVAELVELRAVFVRVREHGQARLELAPVALPGVGAVAFEEPGHLGSIEARRVE